MKTIQKTCLICNSTFQASLSEHKRGNARMCSRKCSYKSVSLKNIKPKEPNVKCSFCDKEFYISNSKRKNSKSGLHFCCRSHKDLAQRIKSGITAIHPPHYKNGKYSEYRKYAIDHYGARCRLCNYDKYEGVLEVHHKDYNRNNNQIENLQVVCPTCHREQHLVNGKLLFRYKDF